MNFPIVYTTEQMEQLQDFISNTFGDGEDGLIGHELVSEYVHTDVAALNTEDGNRCFVTFGMSARRMNAPIPQLSHVELLMFASKDTVFTSQEAQVIMGELQSLSKYPFRNDTFLGPGHTIAASGLFEETFGFDALAFLPMEMSRIDSIGDVLFLAVIPIYQQEREAMIAGNTFDIADRLLEEFGDNLYYADCGREPLANG